jgi:hypothetical protein
MLTWLDYLRRQMTDTVDEKWHGGDLRKALAYHASREVLAFRKVSRRGWARHRARMGGAAVAAGRRHGRRQNPSPAASSGAELSRNRIKMSLGHDKGKFTISNGLRAPRWTIKCTI